MAERIWFQSDVATIGSYRMARDDVLPERPPGVLANLIVFPRSTHEITPRRGGDGAVTDRNSVLLYNRGDSYQRRFIDPVDRCDFLALSDETALEIAGEIDPSALHRPGRPFDRFHGSADPHLFWLARRLLAAARAGSRPKPALEEASLRVARSAFAASRPDAATTESAPTRHHLRIVEDVKAELNEAVLNEAVLNEAVLNEDGVAAASLSSLARSVGASPAHLSRTFRRVTGTTVHRYRTQLRLRASVDHLPNRDLSALAVELGFSSHSHFSSSFRSTFHRTPSQARAELAG